MRYARLKNGELTPAPKTITADGLTICNPTKEQYLSIGWYPVVYTEAPRTNEEKMAVPHWEQKINSIIQVWKIVPVPEHILPKPQPLSLADRIKALEDKASGVPVV